MRALHDLVTAGKIRYLGASSMWAYQFAMMQFCAEKNRWTKFVAMQVSASDELLITPWNLTLRGHQNSYNLLYREEEREMNKFCRETGVAIIPVSHVLLDLAWFLG